MIDSYNYKVHEVKFNFSIQPEQNQILSELYRCIEYYHLPNLNKDREYKPVNMSQ